MFVKVLQSYHLLFKLLIIYSFGISQKFVYKSEILNMFLMCYVYLYHIHHRLTLSPKLLIFPH